MGNRYRIFGSELSPYSVKVRSYFRFKGIPHDWIERNRGNEEEFSKHAKLPLIPLVIGPDGEAMQDSTPILERMEERFPDPSLHPADPALKFVSELIEEYADEWGNKPMFHYRWHYEPDQRSAAERIARQMMAGADAQAVAGAADMVKARMVPRLRLVGSTPETKDQIEASFHRQLSILEAHLARRTYLFGERPALADFGLFCQLYELSTDPTPGKILRDRAPRVVSWIQEMLGPRAEGDFESWETLAPTLGPLLRDEVGAVFLPWTTANAKALAAGQKEFTVQIDGRPFSQEVQKYHAKSLGVLRARYAAVADRSRLDPILEEARCLEWLR